MKAQYDRQPERISGFRGPSILGHLQSCVCRKLGIGAHELIAILESGSTSINQDVGRAFVETNLHSPYKVVPHS